MPHPPSSIALVVHGHFYQPPRENPWTDEVPREPSAAPYHDWNARIDAESYRANAWARIYGPEHRIDAIVNNYERLSFNFGPTLARWLERHDPGTEARLRAGDAEQRRRLGHSGAIAQVWAHPIAPLLSARDLRTQILWGIQDYERRFGHAPEGMWLPETAVDTATLEALIDAGITYTILAPEQVAAVRGPGKNWTAVTADTVDTGRAYRWEHGDGSRRSITLAVFDGPLSRSLAFGNATRDAHSFISHVKEAAGRSSAAGPRLVVAASDGELYGHHKTFADLTVAYATWREAPRQHVKVTNLGAYLEEVPAEWEAELHPGPDGEGTAWSCAHGVGRWRRHCGCAMRPDIGWSQAWRGPLRAGLDLLRDKAGALFEEVGGEIFGDPWDTRDAYGSVVDHAPAARLRFLRGLAKRRGRDEATMRRALLLLEMQRATFLMYASCGWFFDDVAGLESALVLRQAAHVIDLWRTLGGKPPVNPFLEMLGEARSNQAELGTGADVFRRVSRDRVTPARAVAEVAFSTLAKASAVPPAALVRGFEVELNTTHPVTAKKLTGRARVTHNRTGETTELPFSAEHDGATKYECRVDGQRLNLDDLDEVAAQPFRLAALAKLVTGPPSLKNARAALTLADAVGRTSTEDGVAVRGMIGDLLVRFLDGVRADRADAETWATVESLCNLAALPAKTRAGHLVEELIWDRLFAYRQARRAVPKPLRLVAERLGFSEPSTETVRASG